MTTHRLQDLHPPARVSRPALQVRASVHVGHPAVRRDAQLPLGRGALPRRGDGHGRICDVQAMNAKMTASTVGYWVGALTIPGYELPWEETPSGRGPLTIEMDTSNGASDQVRRAGDHGLHALLCAAHPKRQAPRVPEADHVLGRRGPAGRPAPAQGQPEKDMLVVKVGGPAYHIAIPHRSTTSLYHLAIPHRSTTSASAVVCPMR